MIVEWKGNELYKVAAEGKRILVGRIERSCMFVEPVWTVYVQRPQKQHTFTTEEHARLQLERYAE